MDSRTDPRRFLISNNRNKIQEIDQLVRSLSLVGSIDLGGEGRKLGEGRESAKYQVSGSWRNVVVLVSESPSRAVEENREICRVFERGVTI